MTLDELKATLDTFTPIKIEFVARFMESLANPPNANIKERGTWLTGSYSRILVTVWVRRRLEVVA